MKLGLYLAGLGAVLGCGTSSLTAEKLEAAMETCGQAKGGAEGQNISCSEALPYIRSALDKYGLTTPEEIAFYISVLSIESGNLSYNRNVFPGRPGQGTRSMMMPNNLYAFLNASPDILAEHPELQDYASKPYDDSNDVAKNKALEVLMDNKYSFLPGAWWIKEGGEKAQPGCTGFKTKLSSDISISAVDELLSSCLGVSHDPARTTAYQRALNAVKC